MRFCPALVLCLACLVTPVGCQEAPPASLASADEGPVDATRAILDVLNAETRDALGRDYEAWREHWVHAPYVVKTYVNVADGTGSETLGWTEVDAFVRTYLEAHPKPEAPPMPLTSADIRLYGDGAFVTYEQQDGDQGRKRESRLMEKVDGAWRIAGMHTTVYAPAE